MKAVLKVFLITEMLKPLDLYVFFLLKWVYIEKIDKAKCIFFLIKDEKLFNLNIMKLGKKSATSSWKNLTENLYTMKNI